MKNEIRKFSIYQHFLSHNRWLHSFLILLIILLLIVILGSIKARDDISTDMKKAQELFLSKYTLNISTNITNPINNIAEVIGAMLLSANESTTYSTLKSQMTEINSSSSAIKDILLFIPQDDGQNFDKITSYSSEVINSEEFHDMVYPYFSNTSIINYPNLSFQVVLLDAYRDSMNLATKLPVLVQFNSILTDGNSYAIIDFDLTSLLTSMEKSFEFDAYGKSTMLTVSIYNKDGLLLESSKNTDYPQVPVLEDGLILEHLNSYKSELGLFITETETSLTMYSLNQELGLYFGVTVPSNYISESSRDIQNYVLFIGLFIVFILFIFFFLIMHTAKDYQEYEKMEYESRFDVLQSRMKPHFLFNTLDSIVYTIEDDEKGKAMSSIKALSYILRFDLREEGKTVPLSSQIKYIRNYVKLQKIRYKDRFTFKFDIEIVDYNIEDIQILKYCIQPLVENSFVHSVHQGSLLTNINVRYTNDKKNMYIYIFNDEVNITKEEKTLIIEKLKTNLNINSKNTRGQHIGLGNINQRIKLLYGESYGISLIQANKIFEVKVTLPLLLNSEENK
jgi:hypothetical protein